METTKKTSAKKKKVDDTSIISTYMDWVLEHNTEPKNVYSFCKENKIDETDFYTFFGSLEALKQEIWVKLFENVESSISKEADFSSYSNKNKLLTLYFTFFEILALNRSYIVFSLKENKEGLKHLKSLKKLRNRVKDFVDTNMTSEEGVLSERLDRFTRPVYAEGAWVQFLFLLKYWLDDDSKGFEKTDILIEKSVHTVVDLLNTKPLESLIDLGKFLWKEKMN